MIALANLFLIGFALDGAVSVLDDLSRIGSGPAPLSAVRSSIAFAVLFVAIGNFIALAFEANGHRENDTLP